MVSTGSLLPGNGVVTRRANAAAIACRSFLPHRPPTMAVSPRATVAERSWETLRSGTSDFLSVLDAHLGVRIPGFLPPAECAALARRVYAGRPFWISDFDGVQFSLGRAWYTHLEQEREDEYFANA